MMSTDFGSILSPTLVGKKAKGGKAEAEPPKHHVTVIIPVIQPHPIVGALTHALMLHHYHRMRGGR